MPKAKPCATPLALPRRFRTPIIIAWQCYSCCTIVTMQSRHCDGCLNVERSQKAIEGPEPGWVKSTKFSFLGKRRNGLATQPRIIAIVGCWTFALARPCNLRHRKNTVVLACVRPHLATTCSSPAIEDECSLCEIFHLDWGFSIQPCSAHAPEGMQSKLGPKHDGSGRKHTAGDFR